MPRKAKTDPDRPFIVSVEVSGTWVEIARLGSPGQTKEFTKCLTVPYDVVNEKDT